ncbi:hypothetical protein DSM03_101337 [Leeuwenhoekiella aestuarii]|uniref:DUF5689 domain-containing protein n=1 Tax=Leeuwenhoekiella aestuarii TaxID=2249426 RepID=A0A4Q0NTZ5_9FLAO|nr:DUF5689 domain-containing protein [Leeuwenhoekiella aestuarii]RXG14220.1 hypothetical protein DSM04_104328 [Leeuwenhoekiella aestuarii]RXG18969.1 hypothetical protein DSM03_101337 [Leeuwenhoekiella aestuarii]
MKALTYLNILLVLSTLSCVTNEFEVPDTSLPEVVPEGTEVPITSVINNLTQSTEPIIEYEDSDTYLTGYVISSDVAGNFYHELVIQDAPENPQGGITIQLNQNAIYTLFEPGRKVYVYLDGLAVTTENGIVQLGIRDGNGITDIPNSLIAKHILRTTEVATLVPLPLSIADFSEGYENLFISLEHAQFNRDEVLRESIKTFAGEVTDEFDGIRLLETCDARGRTLVSTSTFAKFKSVALPTGSGTIQGVLSRDFYDDFYIIRINTTAAIDFTNAERCDPVELKCGLAEVLGTALLFEDDFSEQTRNNPIEGNGWTNFIEYGIQAWEAYTATGNNASQGVSARIDSYQSGDALSVCWLVTPAIDLASNTHVRIRFETSSSFADGSDLEVLFSSDWDGDAATITQANWSILGDAFVIRDQDFFGDWYSSGIVNLSCATGETGYVAFKYTGSTHDDFDGTYQLDNISITAD